MPIGFHTRQDLKQAVKKPKRNSIPLETIKKLGHRAVRDMNPAAKSPNMQPVGPGEASLYVLCPFPTAEEDRKGKPLVHREADTVHKFLRRARHVRIGHVVRTMPSEDAPKEHEIVAFSREVIEDIEAAKPKCILAMGDLPFQLLQPGIAKHMRSFMHIHRGRRFPVRVGSHVCWMVPTFDPVTAARMRKSGDDMCNDGKEWSRFLDEDLRLAVDISKRSQPPGIREWDVKKLLADANTQLIYQPEHILDAMQGLVDSRPGRFAFDYEGTCLRPYQKDARLLSLAIATNDLCLSFPLQHHKTVWKGKQWDQLLDLWWELLQRNEAIAHGLEFEAEWTYHLLGRDGCRAAKRWHCTIAQAYVLSSRAGRSRSSDGDGSERGVVGLSLDYLARLYEGFPLKMLSPGELWKETGQMTELLRYNAGDAILTLDIWNAQMDELEEQKLEHVYERQVRRIPTAVLSQIDGQPVDRDTVIEVCEKYEGTRDTALRKLHALDECQEFRRRFGHDYRPNAPEDVKRLFSEVLEHDMKSASAANLAALENVEFAAKYTLEYKKHHKIYSTYIQPIDHRNPDNQVFPDGRVHCRYYTTRTETGRVSSGEPNMTNQPERGIGKDMKRCFAAPDGWEWTAFDYGQIEARVLGMASKDRVFCKALWTGYDVHMEWAEKIARLFPEVLRRHDNNMKKWRAAAKNQVVFPWFFGAGLTSVARNIRVDPDRLAEVREEFWDTFSDSKNWQKKTLKRYEKTGYVETLTGRRRQGPMSYNMKINGPIQGTTADIVFDAWDRVSELAEREGLTWLQPNMMVHDDLKFLHPISERDTIMKVVPKLMLDLRFDFINVPIVIEASRGPNLAEMPEIGEFSSED